MIDDLDSSLENLLKFGLQPNLVEQLSISFATPDEDFPPASVKEPAIDMFLYDVRENQELRSSEWIVDRSSGTTVTRRAAPRRVDCSYLVTAWVNKGSKTQAKDEHHLLGEVMRLLLRYPTLPAEVLHGALASQQPPLPAITLHAGRLQSPGEFWQALGGKPKAAFHYTVTIGVDVGEPLQLGPPVTDKTLKFEQTEVGS